MPPGWPLVAALALLAIVVVCAVVVLGRRGVVSARQLRDHRRWFIVGSFVVAVLLTPPDAISQFAVAVPLLLLYEASYRLLRLV